jgi:hypothetical protein
MRRLVQAIAGSYSNIVPMMHAMRRLVQEDASALVAQLVELIKQVDLKLTQLFSNSVRWMTGKEMLSNTKAT